MEAAEAAIRANNQKFSEAFMRGDAAGVASLYTADARLLPPDAPMTSGTESIRQFWEGAMRLGIKEAALETLEVRPCGEYACELGRFTLSVETGAGARAEQTGKYVVIWKQSGGGWKLDVDIWNTP
ncbi:MAG TPA: SgcJ/EcaC family oxidoreductase [Pyrinomonadaceae bacterium]|jgi:uncharacterized protein (TIGR02246 family)|nr:SgcJ/EcaC family oxidoreductase [Pyrinomonadaceae bacterium]